MVRIRCFPENRKNEFQIWEESSFGMGKKGILRGRASIWIPENYFGDDAVSWKRRMGEDHGNAQIARMQRFPDAEKREKGENIYREGTKARSAGNWRYTAERYNERTCHPRKSPPMSSSTQSPFPTNPAVCSSRHPPGLLGENDE